MMPTTPPELTVQGAILGTFQYRAPEQIEGLDADARTDIFAFGGGTPSASQLALSPDGKQPAFVASTSNKFDVASTHHSFISGGTMIRRDLLREYSVLVGGLVLASCMAISCSRSPNPVGASLSSDAPTAGLNDRRGDAGDSDVGKMLYKFNVIAKPKGDWGVDDDECTNNGHRIFFEEGNGNTLGTINWEINLNQNPDFQIADCDATSTSDDEATVLANQSVEFWVMIRLLGPKTSNLSITCHEVFEAGPNDDLCILGNDVKIAFNRNEMTKFMQNLVDVANEGVLGT